jgi:hypothetical protein
MSIRSSLPIILDSRKFATHYQKHAHQVDASCLIFQCRSSARVANDDAFLMVVPFHAEPKMIRKGWLAGLIMLGAILLAAFNLS